MTAPESATSQRRGLTSVAKVLLFVVLPIVVIAVIVSIVLVALSLVRVDQVEANTDTDAGSSVAVNVPNADLAFRPSDDSQVHVSMTGHYSGQKPTVQARLSDGETQITGGCPNGWNFLARCDVSVVVSLPEDLALTVEGRNGRITAFHLAGDLDLRTTNGRIQASASSGGLKLHTTNGAIQVLDAASGDVRAETTNGAIEMTFAHAPDTVSARSTNGGISIRVPDDREDYFVDARTTNGNVNTDAVPSDRNAEREITAETTNGGVTVERTRS